MIWMPGCASANSQHLKKHAAHDLAERGEPSRSTHRSWASRSASCGPENGGSGISTSVGESADGAAVAGVVDSVEASATAAVTFFARVDVCLRPRVGTGSLGNHESNRGWNV